MLIWLIFFIYVSKIYSLNIPTGLLCDLKASPAMGVGLTPRFDWINPHLTQCHGDVTADPPLTDQVQYAYQIQIAPNYDTTFNKLIWDSNVMKTTKTANTFPLIQIPNHGFLKPAHTYLWRVRVWATQDCVSDWSVPAKFVSGLHVATGFDDSTKPIWAGDDSKYAFLRSVVSLNGKVSDAHIYVGAAQDGPMEKILGSYRLYVNGQVTTTGPGRGEVPYTDANHSVYDTIDITTSAQVAANADGKLLLALQGFHTSGKDAKIILELHVTYSDGSKAVLGTNSTTFTALDATEMFNPSSTNAGEYPQPLEDMDAGSSAYTKAGLGWAWREQVSFDDSEWSQATEQPSFGYSLPGKTTLPLEIIDNVAPATIVKVEDGHYFFDFGSELMGGPHLELLLNRLQLNDANQGITLTLKMSEELCNSKSSDCKGVSNSNTTVKYPMRTGNKFQNIWTAPASLFASRGTNDDDNKIVFETHEYYTFRYGELWMEGANLSSSALDGNGNDGLPFNLTFWVVRYPWNSSDTFFESSDDMLNSVWELCSNTLKVTSLDTTTDSNTRERRPYEADGQIAGASREVLQRNALAWNHHSYRHNYVNPTWPTEWRQVMPLVARNDYMATGDLTLAQEFWQYLINATQLSCQDPVSGLINYTTCPRCEVSPYAEENSCKDIVDWPEVDRDGYVMTDINTVINAYAVGGLDAMAVLANASGQSSEDVSRLSDAASTLRKVLNEQIWNSSVGTYQDGLDEDGKVILHTAFHAAVFPLYFEVPDTSDKLDSIVKYLGTRRMAGSVYAAYGLLHGLYNAVNNHGTLALDLLTSCDDYSYCSMIKAGATATMEAWKREEKPNLSWSHAWASAPASAIATGLMGIKATSPAFQTFKIQPQPGNLTWGAIRMPSLPGFFDVNFNATSTNFTLVFTAPADTTGNICLPLLSDKKSDELIVDGNTVHGQIQDDYVCVDGLGSAAQPRIVQRLS